MTALRAVARSSILLPGCSGEWSPQTPAVASARTLNLTDARAVCCTVICKRQTRRHTYARGAPDTYSL